MKLHANFIATKPARRVFLHGLLGDGSNLRHLATVCAGPGEGAVLLDLRNHGRSPHSPVMTWEAMAADVLETLDDYGIRAFHLVGHSLGGKVAMAVAESMPDRVLSLSVLDIAPVDYSPTHHSVLAGMQSLDEEPPETREEAIRRLLSFVPDQAEANFLLKNLKRDDEGVLRLRCNLKAIIAAYPGLLSSPLAAPAGYGGPVCFLKGERSPYIDERASRIIQRCYPHAKQACVANAGHWLHFEQADTVAAMLQSFWDGFDKSS